MSYDINHCDSVCGGWPSGAHGSASLLLLLLHLDFWVAGYLIFCEGMQWLCLFY